MDAETVIFSIIYFGLVFVLIWINYDYEIKYPDAKTELTFHLDKLIQEYGIVRGLTILFIIDVIIWLIAVYVPLLVKECRGFVVGFIFFNVVNDLKVLLREHAKERRSPLNR